jgi:hypothetical protein
MRGLAAGSVIVLGMGLALALGTRSARGQRVETGRAKTIIVGTPAGPSPSDRVDQARSGASRAPLPTGTLHVAWKRNLGLPIEAAPLVDGRGEVTILTARGDLIVLAPDGEERSDTVVGSAAASPATLLSDGTAAFLTSSSDVVGVRLGGVRFRRHLGGGRSSVSPLALDDGGLVVATQGELVALDGEGNVRARATVDPEDPPVHALVGGPTAEGFTVYAMTGRGAVLAWVPAMGRDVARVGSFGGPTDGGMALLRGPSDEADGSHGKGPKRPRLSLVAVQGAELLELDPATGRVSTRATAATSGALALVGPPAVHAGAVSLLALTASRTVAVSFDPAGAELLHRAIAATFLPPLQDGGVGVGTLPPHLGALTDPQGDVAFALPTGELGVASASGGIDLIGEVCAKFGSPAALASLGIRGGPTFSGFAPAAPSALVVACGTGLVARIDNDFAPAP